MPVSLETYARVHAALDLPFELAAEAQRRPSQRREQDVVHAAMGELEARHLRSKGLGVAMDEPYQHYQFAGRADVVAWNVEARALLHLENRTQFPNVQEALGSFTTKRAYLGNVLAERLNLHGGRWASETHVVVALWSSEVLRVLRRRETTFRVACPDPRELFDRWWEGDVRDLRGKTTALVLMDPAAGIRERARFGGLGRLQARPRYRDYREAASRLGGADRDRQGPT